LLAQGEQKGHGKAYTEVGIVLARNPDHLVGADAAFIMNRSLPAREAPEGYLETVPELIVEIRSKNDTTTEINEKVTDYLQAGVQWFGSSIRRPNWSTSIAWVRSRRPITRPTR
jgi:Uma2 family endonuclease